jgi:serine/threonine protein kinase
MAIDPCAAPAPVLEQGTVVDGFRLGERLHRGGMAALWAVTRIDAEDTLPLLMKVPRVPGAGVGFEVEQMMLYQLLTGRPFDHATTGRRVQQRLAREPEPPRSLRADCPPWLQEVVLRCLEVDADARHPSAAQLAFDLRHPEQVTLTDRARRLSPDGAWRRLRRWFAALGSASRATASARAATALGPIVLARTTSAPSCWCSSGTGRGRSRSRRREAVGRTPTRTPRR